MSDSHPSLEHARAVHADLLSAKRRFRRAHHELATLLRRFDDEGLHRLLGYATVAEYARAHLELPPRAVRELLLTARSLTDLPALDAAAANGEIGWGKLREITRVATAETDASWLAFAAAHDTREVEWAVAAARIGAPAPDAPPPPDKPPARHRVSFEMEASDAEILRQALALIRHQTGEAMDGVALAALAARFLADSAATEAGPTGEPYRIIVEVCPSCSETSCPDHELSETVAGEVACDAEVVDLRPGPDRGRLSRAIPTRVRNAVFARDKGRCTVPGCANRLWIHLHHLKRYAGGGAHTEENLTSVCSIHHRLTHDGRLAIYRDAAGNLVFEREDGTRSVTPRPRSTPHVGRAGRGPDVAEPGT